MFLVFFVRFQSIFSAFSHFRKSQISAVPNWNTTLTVVAEVSEGSLRNRLSSVARELPSKARGF